VSGVGLASLERASKELEEHNYLTHELVTQYSLNGRLRLFILLAQQMCHSRSQSQRASQGGPPAQLLPHGYGIDLQTALES
jgi:hypothetical protein